MSSLIFYLTHNGWPLSVGLSVILAIGILGTWLQSSPIGRQRFCEGTLIACLIWLVWPSLPVSQPAWFKADDSILAKGPEVKQILDEIPAHPDRVITPIETTGQSPSQANWIYGSAPFVADEPDSNASSTILLESQMGHAADPIQFGAKSQVKKSTEWMVGSQNDSVASITQTLPSASRSTKGRQVTPWYTRIKKIAQPLAWIYLLGVVFALGWLTLGHVLLARLVKRSESIEPEKLAAIPKCEIRNWPRILSSHHCHRAITFGILRPTIVVPQSMTDKRRRDQLRHVVLHELGHVRQRDAIGQLLLNVAFVLVFFHPLYWMLRRQICFDRELVIDDWAARQTRKQDYVSDLVSIAKSQNHVALGPSLALGAVNYSQSQFYRRIKMLVDRNQPLKTRRMPVVVAMQAAVLITVVFGLALLVDLPTAQGQTDNKKLQVKIEQLTVERESLAQQVRFYQDRLKQLEDVVAQMQTQVATQQNSSQTQQDQLSIRNQQLAQKVAHLEQLLAVQTGNQRNLNSTRPTVTPTLPQNAPNTQSGYYQNTPANNPNLNNNANQQRLPSSSKTATRGNQRQNRTQSSQLPARDPVQQWVPSSQQPNKYSNQLLADSQRSAGKSYDPFAPTQQTSTAKSTADGQQAAIAAHSSVASGGSENLIQLATNYADALAEREIARAELQHSEELVSKNLASKHQLIIAKIRFDATDRKADVMRHVAEATLIRLELKLAQAREQLDHTKQLVDRGFVSKLQLAADEAQLMAIKSSLKIMQKILDDK